MMVAWNRSTVVRPSQASVLVGQIVRVAKEKTWADIRYEIPEEERNQLAIEWEITHRTQRVSTLYLRQINQQNSRRDDG